MQQVNQKKLEEFFANYPVTKYKKGEVIYRPGQKLTKVGFTRLGYVKLYKLAESGQEIMMEFFKPILFLTTIFAMTGKENEFYFQAITPTEITEVPNEEMMEFFHKNPEVAKDMMNTVMVAFLDLMSNAANLLAGNAYNRVALMVESLTKRMEGKDADYAKIDFGITHKMIASLTGLTRETVTLQMIKLEKEGVIINKSKSIQVVDKEKLKKATEVA